MNPMIPAHTVTVTAIGHPIRDSILHKKNKDGRIMGSNIMILTVAQHVIGNRTIARAG